MEKKLILTSIQVALLGSCKNSSHVLMTNVVRQVPTTIMYNEKIFVYEPHHIGPLYDLKVLNVSSI